MRNGKPGPPPARVSTFPAGGRAWERGKKRKRAGTLPIVKGRCPTLVHEAGLYAYSKEYNDRHGETPDDARNLMRLESIIQIPKSGGFTPVQ